jgi:tartrate-resistant acid phosphatase type 5
VLSLCFLGASQCKGGSVKALSSLELSQYSSRVKYFDSAAEKIQFFVIGDQGTGDAGQAKVAKALFGVCEAQGCDFGILLGDNFYPGGVKSTSDSEWNSAFEKMYAPFKTLNFWSILGNHDWMNNAQAEIDYTLKSKLWLMPAQQYDIVGLPAWVKIHALDTEAALQNSGLMDAQKTQARSSLCDEPAEWKFLLGHHPIYSSGQHGNSSTMKKEFEPIIKDCGVQVYFSGHDHHQEHLDLGDYQQVVQGAGGKLRDVAQGKPHQLFAASTLGFARVELTPQQIDFEFYDANGDVIYQWRKVK